jgi:integrase
MTKLRQRMIEELQLRNSAEETVRAYVSSVKRFAAHYRKSPDQLNAEDVRRYLLHLRNERKLSWSGIQVYRAALRFFYVRVLKQRWFDDEILPPKRHPKLPTVLSAGEVTKILDATRNLKHWTILATLYATGLRSQELRHLKIEDIDRERIDIARSPGQGPSAARSSAVTGITRTFDHLLAVAQTERVAVPFSGTCRASHGRQKLTRDMHQCRSPRGCQKALPSACLSTFLCDPFT